MLKHVGCVAVVVLGKGEGGANETSDTQGLSHTVTQE